MGLKGYIARRIVLSVVLLFAVLIFNFFLFRIPVFMWGLDPADLIVGGIDDELIQQTLRENWNIPAEDAGLEAWLDHFFTYITNMLTFNFGQSFQENTVAVADAIWERFPNTVVLVGSSSVVMLVLSVFLGTKAASNRGKRIDVSSVVAAMVFYSVPVFWLGMIALLVFGFWFDLVPLYGSHSNTCLAGVWEECGLGIYPPLDYLLDYLWHLITPATVMMLAGVGSYLLIMRNTMVDVMTEDYIKVARAKGLDEKAVIYKHALKNSMLPFLTVILIEFGVMIDGAILTETVFNWYGLGRYIFDSLIAMDWPASQAIFFMIAVSVVLANFAADIMYGVMDPRIKYL